MSARFMMRSLCVAILFGSCVAWIGGVVPTAASAAPSSPRWQIDMTSYPTVFEQGTEGTVGVAGEHGPGYLVVLTNVGGEPAESEITLSDDLSSGLSPSPASRPVGEVGPLHPGHQQNAVSFECLTEAHGVSCPLGAPGSPGQTPVFPGQTVRLLIPVAVSGQAPATVTNVLSVEGGGAPPASATLTSSTSGTRSLFGFAPESSGSFGFAIEADGSAAREAGGHPYQVTVGFNASDNAPLEAGLPTSAPSGGLSDISGDLPRGMVVDPEAVPTCSEAELEGEGCPVDTQVGSVSVPWTLATPNPGVFQKPLYNMAPPHGFPAELGFEVITGTYIHLLGRVRSDGDYGLSADARNVTAKVGVLGAMVSLWGNPTDPSHDHARGACLEFGGSCSTAERETAFLTEPASCTGVPLETEVGISSWIGPAAFSRYINTDGSGQPVAVSGCGQLSFGPSIVAQPDTQQGDAPSGLEFDLHQPQDFRVASKASAELRDAKVTLPEGLVVNPSAANGLDSCSSSQIGLTTPVDSPSEIHFDTDSATCPSAAKLGRVEVKTPLLEAPLPGAVYLAKPFENPFGSLLAIYLDVEDPKTGIVAKLAGRIDTDESTGQVTATFTENPQLPLEDVILNLYGGQRGTLTTPLSCGSHTTTSTLTPWTTPEGADAHPSDSFQTTAGCSDSEASAPKEVSFSAGTVTPLAAAYSPFILRVGRPDGSQHITGIETILPAGLLGKLAGVAYCPESGIAQARSREVPEKGKEEQSSPSCPSSSEVGTVQVTAGSGSSPIPVSGHAYLAGPYKGAPLSLVVIVPAVAGPFDLGTVVDRVALNVGEYDARIHAVSDPLPTIRDGIPLDVRSVELKLDRPSFTVNPTSCEAMAIEGTVSTQAGQSQSLSNRFQVGDCERLAFKPSLKLSLKGATKKTGHPAVKAVVTVPPKGEFASIARAQVNLPHSEFLDQGNIAKACTKVILAQHACPAKSIYGKARAWTPLLEKPLEGPVYLVGGYGYKLPALVAELNGQIRVLLVGKIDSGKNHGIRNTFEAVPDAPVSRFVLELKGGKKYGLLENSEDVCRKEQVAGVSFKAQNGRKKSLTVKIANSCKRGPQVKKKGPNKKSTH